MRPAGPLLALGDRDRQVHGLLLVVPVRDGFPQRSAPYAAMHALLQLLLELHEGEEVRREAAHVPERLVGSLFGFSVRLLRADGQGEQRRAGSDRCAVPAESADLLHHLAPSAVLYEPHQHLRVLHARLLAFSAVHATLRPEAQEAPQPGQIGHWQGA